MPAIRAQELTKAYGGLRALDGLSFDVEEGEIFGLLGPNGAGKSTTIKILTGQLVPDSGSATVLGLDPVSDPVGVRRLVGVLPEREDPPSFLTPREYFDFVGEVREIPEEVLAERVDRWTRELAFGGKLDTLNKSLSRGERQKVMITQAFLGEPSLVLIDEPLSNLDPIMQERAKNALRAASEAGATVVLSTHNIAVAEELCTRVGILNGGRLLATAEPGALGDGESLLDVFLEAVGEPGSADAAEAAEAQAGGA